MAGKPEGYEEVADRIHRFYKEYPTGTIQTLDWQVVEVAGKQYFVCEALVYRSPDDSLPGKGIAWEPIPGLTPFTRNSEAMNAETSAWGRALASIGLGGKRIATADEVTARTPASRQSMSAVGEDFLAFVQSKKIPGDRIKLALGAMGVAVGNKRLKTVLASMTDEQITVLRGRLDG